MPTARKTRSQTKVKSQKASTKSKKKSLKKTTANRAKRKQKSATAPKKAKAPKASSNATRKSNARRNRRTMMKSKKGSKKRTITVKNRAPPTENDSAQNLMVLLKAFCNGEKLTPRQLGLLKNDPNASSLMTLKKDTEKDNDLDSDNASLRHEEDEESDFSDSEDTPSEQLSDLEAMHSSDGEDHSPVYGDDGVTERCCGTVSLKDAQYPRRCFVLGTFESKNLSIVSLPLRLGYDFCSNHLHLDQEQKDEFMAGLEDDPEVKEKWLDRFNRPKFDKNLKKRKSSIKRKKGIKRRRKN